uniref:SH3 domain-containing protein n=1 Tax=Macrostomum lignano TaxID=282301 RepID=A0A1I8JR40_9PLAT
NATAGPASPFYRLFEARRRCAESEQTDPEVPVPVHWYQSLALRITLSVDSLRGPRSGRVATSRTAEDEVTRRRRAETDIGPGLFQRLSPSSCARSLTSAPGLAAGFPDMASVASPSPKSARLARSIVLVSPTIKCIMHASNLRRSGRAARTLPNGALTDAQCCAFTKTSVACRLACRQSASGLPLVLYSYTLPQGSWAGPALSRWQAGVQPVWVTPASSTICGLGSRKSPHAGLHKQLVHPTFVYCAQFHPQSSSLVATGCYDRIIRVWSIFESACEVVWQLEPHRSHVNAFGFSNRRRVATCTAGDASGQLGVWKCPYTAGTDRPGVAGEWTRSAGWTCRAQGQVHHLYESASVRYLGLLVQTLGTPTLRPTGAASGCSQRGYVVMDYLRENLRSCVSPCGAFVITGSEDGDVYVTSSYADSGDVVATYRQVKPEAAHCLDYHPLDNALAFSSLSHSAANPDLPVRWPASPVEMVSKLSWAVPALWSTSATQCRAAGSIQTHHSLAARSHGWSRKLGGLKKSRMAQDRLDSVLAGGSMRRSVAASTGTMPQVATLLPGAMDSTTPRHLQQQALKSVATVSWMQASRVSPSCWTGPTGQLQKLTEPVRNEQPQREEQQAAAQAPTETVIAILDYKASRSDEISFFKGQRIRVIHKDSQSWWLASWNRPCQPRRGVRQHSGIFPTSYVVNERASRTASLQGDEASPRNGGSASRHIRRLSKDGGALPPQAGRPAAKVKTTRFDDTPIGQSTA